MQEVIQIHPDDVKKIQWTGDHLEYDSQLYNLGIGHSAFMVVNPWTTSTSSIDYIDTIPTTNKCIVWKYKDEWVAKYFSAPWSPDIGYETIEIIKPKLSWSKNPDFDKLMTFENDPYGKFVPDYWDSNYKLVWYIDPKVNPLPDRVWAVSCQPLGKEVTGIKDMGYIMPDINVEYNTDLPDMGIDVNQCYPAFWEISNECAWELDSIHTPEKRMWVIKFSPAYRKPKTWIWYGTISPNYRIEYNPSLPKLEYELDYVIPWHDFEYEHVWYLDQKHLINNENDIWVFKIVMIDNVLGSKLIDYISPKTRIEYNSLLPNLEYELDCVIPWHDFEYEHVWYLDKKHLINNENDIWAFKIVMIDNVLGSKPIDYISPKARIEYNSSLPRLDYELDYVIPWHDFEYEHVWYLDADNKDKIWAARMQVTNDITGEKEIGTVSPVFSDQLDIIFISYHELNADENWQRLLEKAPYAKRIDGVAGIFEAHKAAARLANTDMFFVVDGDAYLTYDWEFDFQPGIFDRDCTYVWKSKNLINQLTYGYGGVKLFNTRNVRSLKSWNTDLTLSVSKKLMVMDQISNITKFNTSEYNTWRAAFRECAKLAKNTDVESKERLQAWLTPNELAEFAEWAKKGAEQGIAFANSNSDITQVNDYRWLKQEFINNYNSI